VLLLAGWLHDWVFSPERAAKIRMANRERWWRYVRRARSTPFSRDDMRAEFWRISCGFETPPDEARARGDLDPQAQQMAMDAVMRNRSRTSGNHQP